MAVNHDSLWWFELARDAIGFLLAAGAGIALWLRKRSAGVWPTTFGKVESVSSYQDNLIWHTDISYSYSVGPDFYSGHFQLDSRSEQRANQEEQRWKGQSIQVRYSPKDPKVSVIRSEDQVGLIQAQIRKRSLRVQQVQAGYCSFAYSALALINNGTSGSASFQAAKKS